MKPPARIAHAMFAVFSAAAVAGCGGGSGASPSPSVATPSPIPRAATATPVASATPAPTAPPASVAQVGGCAIFPADNPWNTDVSGFPADPNSANYMAFMNPSGSIKLHPDFGSDPSYGIPYNVVNPPVPATYATFTFAYASQSDPGPYPVPPSPAIEAGSDKHMLVVDSKTCTLYETFDTSLTPSYTAGSGAVFPLDTDKLRPDGWTSADAAGLPILAGLARYDETSAGAIHHALRFTMPSTSAGYIHPATHDAPTSSDPHAPPMGLRLRLKASYDISGFTGESLVVLTALKKYGMLLADNGSPFFVSGATDPRWDDNDLNALKTVPAAAFEVVQTGTVLH